MQAFQWVGIHFNHEWYDRVAMTVPFDINGITHWFQVDTGSLKSFVFCNALTQKEKKSSPGDKILIEGTVNGLAFEHEFFCAPFERKEEVLNKVRFHTSGILGMDFLENKILSVDFLNNRFSLDPGGKDAIPFNVLSLDYTYSNHLFLHFEQEHFGSFKAMLNTGPSVFPVIAHKDLWTELTDMKDLPVEHMEKYTLKTGFQKDIELRMLHCEQNTDPEMLNLKGLPVYYPVNGSDIFCFKNLDYSAIISHRLFLDKGLYLDVSGGIVGVYEPDAAFDHKGEALKDKL